VVDCEKVGQPLIAWFKENREITAVNDRFDLGHFPQNPDQIPEFRHHLGRATG
jgi:hypothetical protein